MYPILSKRSSISICVLPKFVGRIDFHTFRFRQKATV